MPFLEPPPEMPEEEEQEQKPVYGKGAAGDEYQEIRNQLTTLEANLKANQAIARFARFLASLIGGSMVILIWNTCSRALDTEDQARLNAFRLTTIEGQVQSKETVASAEIRAAAVGKDVAELKVRLDSIDRNGTQPRQAAENKLMDLAQSDKILGSRIEEYFTRATVWHEQAVKDISELKERFAKLESNKP